MYDNCETADCRKLSEAEFMEMMLKIEEQEIAARAANKKIKVPSPSPGKKRIIRVPKTGIVRGQSVSARSARTLEEVRQLTLLMIKLIVKRLAKRDPRIVIIIKALTARDSNLRRRSGRKW
jgi:hypothetical protein